MNKGIEIREHANILNPSEVDQQDAEDDVEDNEEIPNI